MNIEDKVKRGIPLEDYLIIDCHNHIGSWGAFYIPKEGTAESMLESMNNLGIDKVFVTAHSSIGPDYIYGNNIVIDAVKRYPDRFLGYVTVNPNYPENMDDEFNRCFLVEGMRGIKLHPSMHGCSIDYKNNRRAFEVADEKKCPILIHVWGRSDVAIIDRLASEYADAQFIMGHSGAEQKAMEDAILVSNKRPNVYLDLAVSFAFQGNVEWFVKEAGSKKILFGSDMPFYDPRHTFGRIALAQISDEEKRDVLGLNMKKLLNLEVIK
jgi:uncharacterized protein